MSAKEICEKLGIVIDLELLEIADEKLSAESGKPTIVVGRRY